MEGGTPMKAITTSSGLMPMAGTDRVITGDRLLTIREAAELTGLAVGTLYHLASDKRIPVVRLSRRCIRFRLSKLEEWFDQMSEAAENK
jgi:excisionase family DNA binding protein